MAAVLVTSAIAFVATSTSKTATSSFATTFPVRKSDLVSSGRNPYFILEPGYRLVLKGGGEELTMTVLDETKTIDGVETRVIEEYERVHGKLAEISLNYYAIDTKSHDLFYFGEDVEMFRGGRVIGRGGSWHSGTQRARFGMMMPGRPATGIQHYQEQAPGVAMDRAEIVGVHETVATPAGTFKDCVKVAETSGMSPHGRPEYKYYAPGIGLVKYESQVLLQYGPGGASMRKKSDT
jgi:hypothetical protein